MKGKGLTVLEETPELLRAKNATQILNEVGMAQAEAIPRLTLIHPVEVMTLLPLYHTNRAALIVLSPDSC